MPLLELPHGLSKWNEGSPPEHKTGYLVDKNDQNSVYFARMPPFWAALLLMISLLFPFYEIAGSILTFSADLYLALFVGDGGNQARRGG
jgi:hypothetical protein